MIGRYLDPISETVVEREVHSVADATSLLDEVRAILSPRGHPVVEFSSNDGSSLGVASTQVGDVLMWADLTGRYFHSVSSEQVDGFVTFDYFGSLTEAPAQTVVSEALAKVAVTAYIESGSPMTAAIQFVED